MGSQLRWLERTPDKREVDGSIPFEPTSTLKNIQIITKIGKLVYYRNSITNNRKKTVKIINIARRYEQYDDLRKNKKRRCT